MQEEIKMNLEEKMEKTISVLVSEYHTVRAGRANPLLLDKIAIDYYGTETPIKQMAGITVPEPRLLQIQPYDATTIPAIEKAILMSDLGINPSNDGKVIRLAIPMMTEERRKELAKLVKKMGEDSKVALRNERRHAMDALKKLEKSKEITEDELKIAEKEVQKIMDDHVAGVDRLIKEKDAEIMEV